MNKYKVTFAPKGRPNDFRSEVKEIDALSWAIDSGVIFFFNIGDGKEVRVFGAPKEDVVRIEQIA